MYHLHKAKPSLVITTGGLVAIPVCIAAWLLRIPIELYELNATPGKANKFLAPFATQVHVCFATTQYHFNKNKCCVTQYPIRFNQQDKKLDKLKLLDELNFTSARKTLFILGGSQGSLFINNTIKQLVQHHPELHQHVQIIHQTGAHDTSDWSNFYQQHGIPARVFTYNNNLADFYTVADLVVSRAGAGALFETLFFGKKCIVIPLHTKTNNHQVVNAHAIAQEHPELFTVLQDDVDELYERMRSSLWFDTSGFTG